MRYRGYLENISNDLLLGAKNAFIYSSRDKKTSSTQAIGHAINPFTNTINLVPTVAEDLKEHDTRWCIIADYNYGKGSSRERAALEPRFLGGVAVIARGFARILETNLKKQSMLPLTLNNPVDYDGAMEGDRISVVGMEEGEMSTGSQVQIMVRRKDGST